MNASSPPTSTLRPQPRESQKILADVRDLAIRRLKGAFSDILGKVADVLMDRAGRTDVREEQQMLLDAREVIQSQRAHLLAEFDKRLKRRVEDAFAGRSEVKPEFSAVSMTPGQLTLVETSTMDESVIRGNLKRVVETLCYEELQQLNRGVGFLMQRPDLETDGNPLAPGMIVDAFADALREVPTDTRIKFQVLKELNQTSLVEINTIYGEVNKHLAELKIVPGAARPVNLRSDRWSGAPAMTRGAVRGMAVIGARPRSRPSGSMTRTATSPGRGR